MKTTWTDSDKAGLAAHREAAQRTMRLRIMAEQRLYLACIEMLLDRAWTADAEKVLANRAAFEAYLCKTGRA